MAMNWVSADFGQASQNWWRVSWSPQAACRACRPRAYSSRAWSAYGALPPLGYLSSTAGGSCRRP